MNIEEDTALNAMTDSRADGPFVPMALGDMDAPQDAEPVAWRFRAKGAQFWSLTHEDPRPASDYEVQPLYAAPVDQSAEVERLREEVIRWQRHALAKAREAKKDKARVTELEARQDALIAAAYEDAARISDPHSDRTAEKIRARTPAHALAALAKARDVKIPPLTEDDREWIDAEADRLFRESERQRGSVRGNTITARDFRDYFVADATYSRILSTLSGEAQG